MRFLSSATSAVSSDGSLWLGTPTGEEACEVASIRSALSALRRALSSSYLRDSASRRLSLSMAASWAGESEELERFVAWLREVTGGPVAGTICGDLARGAGCGEADMEERDEGVGDDDRVAGQAGWAGLEQFALKLDRALQVKGDQGAD